MRLNKLNPDSSPENPVFVRRCLGVLFRRHFNWPLTTSFREMDSTIPEFRNSGISTTPTIGTPQKMDISKSEGFFEPG